MLLSRGNGRSSSRHDTDLSTSRSRRWRWVVGTSGGGFPLRRKYKATAHQSYNTRKRNTCKQASGLLDGALDLLAQGFGLCILVALRLRLFGCVDRSSPLNVLLPCCPYCEVLVGIMMTDAPLERAYWACRSSSTPSIGPRSCQSLLASPDAFREISFGVRGCTAVDRS